MRFTKLFTKFICMTVGHEFIIVEQDLIELKNGDCFADTETKICVCCGKIVQHRVPVTNSREYEYENDNQN